MDASLVYCGVFCISHSVGILFLNQAHYLVLVLLMGSLCQPALSCPFEKLAKQKKDILEEIETSPNILNLWADLGLTETTYQDGVTSTLGLPSIDGATLRNYRKALLRHLDRPRGTDISRSHIMRAILVADQVFLNEAQAHRKSLNGPERDDFDTVYRSLTYFSLAKYADLIASRVQIDQRDRSMVVGALQELIRRHLELEGNRVRKIREKVRGIEASFIEILPSSAPLGALAKLAAKNGLRLVASSIHSLSSAKKQGVAFDVEQKLLVLDPSSLVTKERLSHQHIAAVLKQAKEIEQSSSPLRYTYWLNGKEHGSQNILLLQAALRSDPTSWMQEGVEGENSTRVATGLQETVSPILQAALVAQHASFEMHQGLFTRAYLGLGGISSIASSDGWKGVSTASVEGRQYSLMVRDGVLRLMGPGKKSLLEVTPKGRKLRELTAHYEEALKQSPTAVTQSDAVKLAREILPLIKRQQEVVEGLVQNVLDHGGVFVHEMTAIAGDSSHPRERAKEALAALSAISPKLSTLRTIPRPRDGSTLKAGQGALGKPAPEAFQYPIPKAELDVLTQPGSEKQKSQVLERLGTSAVIGSGVLRGWEWRDVSMDHVGYDVYLKNPRTGEEWFVEVKGRQQKAGNTTISLEASEIEFAHGNRSNAVLAVVNVHPNGYLETSFYRDFVAQPTNPGQGTTRFRLSKLLEGTTPIALDLGWGQTD